MYMRAGTLFIRVYTRFSPIYELSILATIMKQRLLISGKSKALEAEEDNSSMQILVQPSMTGVLV